MPVLFFVFVSGFASDFASDLVSGFVAGFFSGSAAARYFFHGFCCLCRCGFSGFHQLVHRLLYRFHRFAVDRLLYDFLHLLCRSRSSLLFLCGFHRFFRYLFLCFLGSLCCFLCFYCFYCFFRFSSRFSLLSGFLLCCRLRCSFCLCALIACSARLRLRIRKYLNRKRCEFHGNRVFPFRRILSFSTFSRVDFRRLFRHSFPHRC